MSLPLHASWISNENYLRNIRFVFYTQDIETWGTWQGHKVVLLSDDGTRKVLLGYLHDSGDLIPEKKEIHIFNCPMDQFLALIGTNRNFDLKIILERQSSSLVMADDFILTRIETIGFGA
ncbi:MAG TPA: hypothetical protein VLR90_21130, partial [Blastocatellia bacterium]|nr:hypothetical protein [Blastocatellia bacterium]